MINVTQETTAIRGTKLELSVEITDLLHHCVQEHIFTKEDLQYFVELACKTDSELREENDKKTEELKQAVEELEDVPDKVKDFFTDLLSILP